MALNDKELQLMNELMAKMEGSDFGLVAKMYKYAQGKKQQKAADGLRVGDKVQWNSKYGKVIQGTITKVNLKTIKISTTTDGNWSVSPSLLTKV